MRLLLDTHVAIWAASDPVRLGARGRALVEDERNDLYASAVCVWEIAIKWSLAPRRGNPPPFSGEEALRILPVIGITFLNVTPEHAALVETLPPIHADPFDRLLVAQALFEPMRLVTADAMVARYSDTVIRLD